MNLFSKQTKLKKCNDLIEKLCRIEQQMAINEAEYQQIKESNTNVVDKVIRMNIILDELKLLQAELDTLGSEFDQLKVEAF